MICEEDTLVSGNWGMLSNKDGVIVDRRQGSSSSSLQDQEFIAAIRENRPLDPPGVDAADCPADDTDFADCVGDVEAEPGMKGA